MECDVCGNEYRQSFSVELGGESFTFDCFECAIHKLAPECAHCGCKVIGHGEEVGDQTFCCQHCVRESGAEEIHAQGDADEDVELADDEDDDADEVGEQPLRRGGGRYR